MPEVEMKKRNLSIVMSIFVIIGVLGITSFLAGKKKAPDHKEKVQPPVLVPFKIEDQFKRIYTEKYVQHHIAIIIGSGRGGNEFNHLWSQAIRGSLEDKRLLEQIKFIGVADLKGVPFFAKNKVKKRFPPQKKHWRLCDWKGHFAKTYMFRKNNCNILIFDQNGILVHKTFGRELDQQKLTVILKVLNGLFKPE
jgi:hypothetical protein